jgi:hypothetical protein
MTTPNPHHASWRRILLFCSFSVAIVIGLGLPMAIREAMLGPWMGMAAVLAAPLVIGWARLWRQRREDRRWQAVKEEVVHTEKIEALGETIGGLTFVVEAPQQGGLAVSDQAGGLGLVERD